MSRIYRCLSISFIGLGGNGYIAGEAPDSSDPETMDGRYRVLNVPSVGRITVHERGTMRCVAQTFSDSNGTWNIDKLNTSSIFFVVGWDEKGAQNAAIQDWVKPKEK